MSRLFSPAFNQQFFDENGKPLAAGKLYTYVAGSSTPVATYKAITGSAMNTNPIILDAAGYADFVLEVGASYKFVLKDKNDAFKKEWDNVTAADISSLIEGLITDIEGKADRANPSTNGNLAALDAYGNVKDSHHKATDFATAAQGAKADTAYQMPDGGIPSSDMTTEVQESLEKADTAYQMPDGGIPSSDMTSSVRSALDKANTAYQKPVTGIPSTDMSNAVQTSLNKADTAYQKPVNGIPSSDMTSSVQTALDKANTAYQKPASGIPSTDMASAVQTSLSKADSAYQMPSGGIPSTDMTTQVQNALSLALSSIQGHEVDTYDNNPKSRHVLLFTANVASAAYASCIVKFVNIAGNGNNGSSVSILVSLVARGTSDINIDARVISNNNWNFGSNFPAVMYYLDTVGNTVEVRIALMEYDSDFDDFLATEMNYLRTNVIPLPKASNVTWNLTAHSSGGRTGQVNVVAGLTGVYGTLPRVDVNLTSGTNNIYLDRNALYRLKCAAGSSIINLLSHNATPLHCPIQILKNNQCEVLTLNWYNDAGYGESAQVSFDSSVTKGYQGDIAYFDVDIWKDGANVIRRWMD